MDSSPVGVAKARGLAARRGVAWSLLLAALEKMRGELAGRIERDAKVAAANARLRAALDSVRTNVMVADEGHDIIYMNDTARTLFTTVQDEIRLGVRDDPAQIHIGAARLTSDPVHPERGSLQVVTEGGA